MKTMAANDADKKKANCAMITLNSINVKGRVKQKQMF